MSTTPTTIRLDSKLRKELDQQLKATGLTLNAYFTLAAKQFVIQNKVPFSIVTPEYAEPNLTTKKALLMAEARELGLIPDDAKTFSNADDMFAALDNDDEE